MSSEIDWDKKEFERLKTKLAQTEAELQSKKHQLSNLTDLAWMSMQTNMWRHRIEGYAVNIRNFVEIIQIYIQQDESPEKIIESLDLIEMLANKILYSPTAPPALTEGETKIVNVVKIIEDKILQQENYELSNIRINFKYSDKRVFIQIDPDWLSFCLDILIDNAVEAMEQTDHKNLTIMVSQTDEQDQKAKICISDTGKGISAEIRPKLFNQLIKKDNSSGKLGAGLFLTQLIITQFNGNIYHKREADQTTFVIELPIYNQS